MTLNRTEARAALNQARNGSMRDMEKVVGAMFEGDFDGVSVVMEESGGVPKGVRAIELKHSTTIVSAAIADAKNHRGFLYIVNTSNAGVIAHKVTLESGTFDGTNDTATLNAPGEALFVFFDADGRGYVIVNTGAVALSSS